MIASGYSPAQAEAGLFGLQSLGPERSISFKLHKATVLLAVLVEGFQKKENRYIPSFRLKQQGQ